MYILTNNDIAFIKGDSIEIGRWENDPTMDTYKIENAGVPPQYAVIADFKKYEVENLPEDFLPNKYGYNEEKGFWINPEWEEEEEKK